MTTERSGWLRAVLVPLLVLEACTAIEPARVALPSLERRDEIAHADLDEVHRLYVDERGRVDYPALKRNPGRLERYYLWLANESPDNTPWRFPTREDELAYWINAYNASVLVAVVRRYPLGSVTHVRAPLPLHALNDKIGFFYLQHFVLGGETVNLYSLENSILRERYRDPRIHFAINCASAGCPRLPREAFTARRLDQQLDRETQRFFDDPRNLRFDHDLGTVYLSPILDWYAADFIQWLAEEHPERPADLLSYVSLYAPPEHRAALLRARTEGYEIVFPPYDWALNDQAAKDPDHEERPGSIAGHEARDAPH